MDKTAETQANFVLTFSRMTIILNMNIKNDTLAHVFNL